MKHFLLIALLTVAFFSSAQKKVLVSEGSIKIAAFGEENLYFGFATDDKIIFSFSEENEKEIKEVEIIEYPSSSRYTDFKVSSAKEKTVTVNKEGVYRFRFNNNSITKRVCRYTIERIPGNELTRKFNTTVTWITKNDTIWKTDTKNVIVGYDTTYIKQTKKVAVSTEKHEELLLDKVQRVHSETNSNGNKTWLNFTLPANIKTESETKTVVAWAYWVGVGKEANEAWEKNVKSVSKLASGVASTYLTPLGALAVGTVMQLILPTMGEDVSYSLTDQQNKDLFMAGKQYYVSDQGKGVAGYKKITSANQCQGTHYICLYNDNYVHGIDASIKVVAIIETVKYEDQPDDIILPVPRFEKQIFSTPEINTYQMPVIVK